MISSSSLGVRGLVCMYQLSMWYLRGQNARFKYGCDAG